ncbi:Hint domain-containing protein [Paracoccus caeni]|uniref:Hint domain-containing protein n=1 Tax=Paracoccus caeni TaxID=657651 RepID=A0A934SK35_9RHOB|nr:Hint domain-containing protein [Paracoccus caeni]MBK4216559.1 Hint domain-containing protein [Paracoccus caeni]
MATTWNAIYLGQVSTSLDPSEGSLLLGPNYVAENAANAAFVGRTFGSAANPLNQNIVSVEAVDNFGPLVQGQPALNQSDRDGVDQIRVDLNGDGIRETYNFDATVTYNSRVTFEDGTTATLILPVFQTSNGHLFLAPGLSDATNSILTSKAITSIRFNSVGSDTFGGLATNRPVIDFICFAAGTQIRTVNGEMKVEDLLPGDLVVTADHGPLPIRWIGQAEIDLQANPKLRPIRIRAGALGQGMPEADLIVSPQHRVLVRSKIAQRMFGTDEVLVAAKQLLELDGIDLAEDLDKITYVHFLFDQHQVVWSNGALTESLFTGAEALKSVGPVAREEIFSIFPELRDQDGNTTRAPVRPLIGGRQARQMASRHAGNGKRLVG